MSHQHVTHLDWLTCTKHVEHATGMIPYTGTIRIAEKLRYAGKWFDVSYRIEPAGTFSVRQGEKPLSQLTLTGKDLAQWRKAGVSDNRILENIHMQGATATRLDVAVNLLGGGDIEELVTRWEEGEAIGSARSSAEFRAIGERGHTLYLGSRKSDMFIRAYDKAAEMKLLGEIWTRVELQSRRQRADNLVRAMQRSGDIASVAKTQIKKLAHFPTCDWWCSIMKADTAEIDDIPRKQSDILRWLRTQVAPQFSKEYD